VHRDGVDLGGGADRLKIVAAVLRVVAAHGVGPNVARVDLREPFFGAVADVESDHGARFAGVQIWIVGGRARRRGIDVGAEKDGARVGVERWRTPDRAGAWAEVEHMVAPTILDRNGRVEPFRLGAEAVFPHDLAGRRLQGDDEAPAGAAFV